MCNIVNILEYMHINFLDLIMLQFIKEGLIIIPNKVFMKFNFVSLHFYTSSYFI